MNVLLRTVHGSHLYGLNHPGSDQDIYEVIETTRTKRRRNIKQTIDGKLDRTVVDMSTFMHMVDECVPQALEALWTPVAEIDKISNFRNSYRVNRAKMRDVYVRTAINFAHHEDEKHRRHALRLLLNLGAAMEYGKFNPRLSSMDKLIIKATMSKDTNKYEDVFVGMIEEVQKWI